MQHQQTYTFAIHLLVVKHDLKLRRVDAQRRKNQEHIHLVEVHHHYHYHDHTQKGKIRIRKLISLIILITAVQKGQQG